MTRPRLELISYAPRRRRGPPLLFVHGAYAAAWCWDEHFLPYFSDSGFPVCAVSLRGHGGSEGGDRLALTSLDHYVEDVTRAVESMDEAPVLIGHSMGGLVVQRYLAGATAPGAVLMASVPPHGLLPSAFNLALNEPALFGEINVMQHMNSGLASVAGTRRAVFSDHVPESLVRKHMARMQPESPRAIFDMSWGAWMGARRRPSLPLLVLGAENDRLVAPQEVKATARAFQVEAEISRPWPMP